MEINGTHYHIAYFRENTHSDQCELLFNLKTEVPGLGALSEEFKSVRQRSDTVASLLQHTQNKVIKYLQDTFPGDDQKDLIKDLNIPCTIRGDTKPLKSETELRNLSAVLRVVTYNILAERYTTIDENYNYCEPRYLSMNYRKQLICKELLGYNADIICLQEVDNRHYHSYFKKQLKENGYHSFFNKKGNCMPEGLALFFNKERFKQVESKHMVYSVEIETNKNYTHLLKLIRSNSTLRDDFLKQHTSLQVTVLKMRNTNKYIIIGNTHLYYHPDANHIRLIQAAMATSFLGYLRRKYSKMSANVSVIFCGDFNSSPKKSLLPFMLKGKIKPTHQDVMKINNNGKAHLSHQFVFESACGTPKYTNYTPDFKDCLDYIFIERNKMTVKQIVPVTEDKELEKYEGLPNEFFPSDHLALVVDLKYIQ